MKKLIERTGLSNDVKASNRYKQLGMLLNAIEKKILPSDTIQLIDKEVDELNSYKDTKSNFSKAIKSSENRIIRLLESKHKIVPINHYRKLWVVLGMSAFGVPIGISLGLSLGSMGFFAIGFPIGMGIGAGIGSGMDKKALKEGRQLDFEVKY